MAYITSQTELEEAALQYGILPFFRNNIKGFSVEEMSAPGLLFGGNEYEGCWEWKGPVVRTRTTAYGKFFRRKAGFVSLELLPLFLAFRREVYPIAPGSVEEMIYDIIGINDSITSTDLREVVSGRPRRRTACDLPDLLPSAVPEEAGRLSRHAIEGPLQRLQMGGWICISDFRYKHTKRGERYGWGVAEYSTPETLFGRECLASGLSAAESRERLSAELLARIPSATPVLLSRLLS